MREITILEALQHCTQNDNKEYIPNSAGSLRLLDTDAKIIAIWKERDVYAVRYRYSDDKYAWPYNRHFGPGAKVMFMEPDSGGE